MKLKNKNSGYTILVSLMIIGFLVVVTTWILNLVIRELNDNKWGAMYLQSFAWAEAAMELALLEIKKNGYWVYEKKTDLDILATPKSEIKISYDLNSKTKSYNWNLSSFEQVVIPLFYLSWSIENKIKNMELKILNNYEFVDTTKMAWNIVSENWDWVWWNSEISNSSKANGRNKNWLFIWDVKISGFGADDFLNKYNKNYLILINLDPNYDLNFNLSSSDFFTKPVSKIITSATTWKYKQNLETILDNTWFLSILRYSVFSN